MTKYINPITPGEILLTEFLESYNLTRSALAEAIGVPINRISQICNGKRDITPDTAIRLGLFFKTTPEFWINLQSHYNLEITKHKLNIKGLKIHPIDENQIACFA